MFALLHNLDQPCKAKANDVKKKIEMFATTTTMTFHAMLIYYHQLFFKKRE